MTTASYFFISFHDIVIDNATVADYRANAATKKDTMKNRSVIKKLSRYKNTHNHQIKIPHPQKKLRIKL